jgi:hypothetical protein
MIKANAGKLRGVRIMRDPAGVLIDPFIDDTGIQYGYVIVYGEEQPAVFDGTEWRSIMDEEDSTWEDTLGDRLHTQAQKIMELSTTDPVYAELAKIMNITVSVGAPVAETVIDYGAKS